MTTTLITNACVVNENRAEVMDVRIVDQRIEKIDKQITANENEQVIDAQGNWLLPGMIDDQVHFREPGLTHKGNIASESRAAVAGGITSYMEMPNVSPSTTTQAALDFKYDIAQQHSMANYAFYLGATESNLEDIKALDPEKTCGVKVFMGASTGNLLVEKPQALEAIFRDSPVTILTHCEYGPVIKNNLASFHNSGKIPVITDHPIIRDANACYQSSSYAVGLAKKFQSNLHVLHITTEKELELFSPGAIENKRITAEACVHHLWFSEQDYPRLGNLIKCNPAIKAESDRAALLNAVNTGVIDIIATDHAPHTWQEKNQDYNQAPAGLPLVQHALLSLLDHVKQSRFTIEQIVEKTAHNPAKRFNVVERGFIREGYYADLVLVSPNQTTPVTHKNTFYHCQWSPFAGHEFSSKILSTWVNGQQVFDGQQLISEKSAGLPLSFFNPN